MREVVEDLGRALALGAVLLPVAGVLVRYIAFRIGHTVDHSLDLALAESPAVLIAIGLDSLFIGLLVLPFSVLWSYLARAQLHSDQIGDFIKRFEDFEMRNAELLGEEEVSSELHDELARLHSELIGLQAGARQLPQLPQLLPDRATQFLGRHDRQFNWVWRISQVAYWCFLFLLGPFPFTLSATGLFLTQLVVPRINRRSRRFSLSLVWPRVDGVLLIAAIGAGLDGRLDGVEGGQYHFAATVPLADGRYVRLGATGNP